MRFVFLGTGTSAGVPSIGCTCRVCTSVDPRDARLRTSAALVYEDPGASHAGRERVVLIDAGPDLRAQALRAGLTRCDAIFYTHNHVDHTFGLDEVRRFNAVQRSPVHLYAEQHTLDFLRRVYQHIFDPAKNINDSFVATVVTHRLGPELAPVELHGLTWTPIRLLHGRLPVAGFRVEAAPGSAVNAPWLPLAYCTDMSALPPESWPKLEGLATLVIDALRPRKHPTHLSIDEALTVIDRVSPRRAYLIHMAHEVSHEETQATLPPGVNLAYDGLTLGDGDLGPVYGP
jgi:phosphoribosyl 1,2-cyclic phosphate phosphodiesterase